MNRLALWNRIPELGCVNVDVIDREQIHVLYVPCERRTPHSEVQIRRVDARQALTAGLRRVSAEGKCATFHAVVSSVNKEPSETVSQLNIDTV